MQTADKQSGGMFGSKAQTKMHFMEEVDYTMELNTASEESKYVIVDTGRKEEEVKGAFKKKRKGAVES